MTGPTSSSLVETVRTLRDRRQREQSGLFVAEGLRSLFAVERAGCRVRGFVISKTRLDHAPAQAVVARYETLGVPVEHIAPRDFDALAVSSDPRGIALIVEQRYAALPRIRSGRPATWLALQLVRSAGNFGSLLRTAAAAQVNGVILIGDQTDPFDPGCVRSSMGGLFSVPLIRASYGAFESWKRKSGCLVVGTAVNATRDYHSVGYLRPVVLMLGEERRGMTQKQKALCDRLVSIPMPGPVDSLNLAVAGSLMIYEALGQRLRSSRARDHRRSPG